MKPNLRPERPKAAPFARLFRAGGVFLTLLLTLLPRSGSARQPDFVDGYHGGIYGHYPVEWKTRFLVQTLEKHPEWRISLEIEPETWDSVQLRTPGDYERFKALAATPRVEFVNPTYAQPYCYNISGESLIRQFQYGIRKLRKHFPTVELRTYACEEPCFTSCLPQILRQFGYRYASLKCPNTCWGGYAAPYGGESVRWTGPDGSWITTSPRYACEELLEGSVWQTTAWGNEPEYLDACRQAGIEHPVGMCLQDAGWRNGPWIGHGEKIRAGSRYVTWREYFEGLDCERPKERYRFSQEEVRPGLMWGSQVLQRIARQVRRTENLLPAAEKTATIALLTRGFDFPQAEMDEAWRTLMLAQHHDSWIVPYNRLHGTETWAAHIARWTTTADGRALKLIGDAQRRMGGTERIEGDRATLRVCNTAGFARKETVRIALPESWRGHRIAVTDIEGHAVEAAPTEEGICLRAEVPSFGYTTYALRREDAVAEQAPQTDGCTIENECCRITVDPARGGTIRELRVKGPDGSEEWTDPQSEYAFGELRGHFCDNGGFRSSTETPARVTRGRNGDLEQWLLIEGTIASHPFTQRITLRKGSPEIEISLRIDWQHNECIGEFRQRDAYANPRRACYDDRYKLTMLFPAALDDPHLDKDAPFDVCRSTLGDTHYNDWRAIKHQVLLHWVDLAEAGRRGRGLALLSDRTTTYRHGTGEPLGLTVQYSGGGLWGCDYPLDGPTQIDCVLLPHRGGWDRAGVDRASVRHNEPLLCSLHADAAMERRSLLDTGATGYEVVAAYPADGGVVVRLFNASGSGRPAKIGFGRPFRRIDLTDLNGNPTAACRIRKEADGCSVRIRAPRFGVTTLFIHENP